jgi:hypothetical protein
MDWIQEQIATRRRALIILSLYAIVVGGATFFVDIGAALAGEIPAATRALVGIVGVVGGVFAWTFRQSPISGWHILMAWALVQIPVFAWSIEGSLTTQLITFPASVTSTTEVNGVVTSHSEVGVNLVGIALAIAVSRYRPAFAMRPVVAQPA